MPNTNLLIYALYSAFWGTFGLARSLARTSTDVPKERVDDLKVAQRTATAPFSRIMLGFHMLAFGVMYAGVANAVLPNRVPSLFVGQRFVGAGVIVLGAPLIS